MIKLFEAFDLKTEFNMWYWEIVEKFNFHAIKNQSGRILSLTGTAVGRAVDFEYIDWNNIRRI